MQDGFKEGSTVTRKFTVDEGRTIAVAGGEFNVYATPEMIRDIEQTCKQYILEFAGENEDSVGTQVNIAHIGATVMGMSVEVTATVRPWTAAASYSRSRSRMTWRKSGAARMTVSSRTPPNQPSG